MADFGQTRASPVNGSITYPPSTFPKLDGTAGAIGDAQVVNAPSGGPIPPGAVMPDASNQLVPPKQTGGRYGMFPGMGPLNALNGIGTTPGPFGRIPCEAGTYNPLNPNPDNVQGLTTAPFTPPYVTMPPMNTMRGMRGGADMNMSGAPVQPGMGSDFSRANFPMVSVGQADSMRYYAPTAGYGHDFQTFKAPSPVPALMLNTQYDARAFNPACIKTGGRRTHKKRKQNRRFRGGDPVALDAGSFRSLQPGEADSRYDFDFTKKALPSQSAGSRRKRKRSARRARRRMTRRAHRK
jgi:hypothetical protein